MKLGAVVLVSFSVVFLGLHECMKYKRTIETLEDVISFLNMLKNEINYRKSDYFEIYVAGENCKYKYLCFKDKKIFLLPQNNKNIETEFNQFINKIGTTDTDGQLAICDEYLKYFKQLYSSLKEKETSKMRTNMSLSLFGALSIIIVFL